MLASSSDVNGPVAPDLLFNQKKCDAFIVMLHDHGHIPAKLLARHNTIALSIGSPVLFSSVAHGSAHDIAGKGIAEPSGPSNEADNQPPSFSSLGSNNIPAADGQDRS